MKIHIIGCSGTGKTYFATLLSEQYAIPHFDLDEIFWDNHANNYGTKREEKERNRLLNAIVEKDNWIIEGVYYAWLKQSFEKADRIYVLDMPKYLYRYRIIRRFMKRKFGLEKGKKESLQSLCELLAWTDTFQRDNLIEIKDMLTAYEHKVVWITNKKELEEILCLLQGI